MIITPPNNITERDFTKPTVVLGVGSYSLGYATHDNQGGAVKATYVEITENGKTIGREIFKDPVTDRGLKKSAKGLLQVFLNEQGIPTLKDCCTWEEEQQGLLEPIYLDGNFVSVTTIKDIREKIENQ